MQGEHLCLLEHEEAPIHHDYHRARVNRPELNLEGKLPKGTGGTACRLPQETSSP